MFEIVFSFNVKALIYFHIYILFDIPITYGIALVLCQSECTCLHKTVNIVVFFLKSNENTYAKGRALMQMYRVVPITKRGHVMNSLAFNTVIECYMIKNKIKSNKNNRRIEISIFV